MFAAICLCMIGEAACMASYVITGSSRISFWPVGVE